MIIVSDIRCSDCLQDFADRARFAVIKDDKSQPYTDEERLLGGYLYHVYVCEDCSKWYEDPVRIV
jgi:DNA-directed RNA polymerase subunit RPC12/RpoP